MGERNLWRFTGSTGLPGESPVQHRAPGRVVPAKMNARITWGEAISLK